MKWLYHKDVPDGRLFNDADQPDGWVDSPAKIGQSDHSELTKKQLMAALDQRGIAYQVRQSKAELQELLDDAE